MARKNGKKTGLVLICLLLAVLLAAGCFQLVKKLFRAASGPETETQTAVSGTLNVWLLDVGQGQAVLFQAPDGKTLLVDCGGDPALTGSRLKEELAKTGMKRIDTLLLSHGHADHAGGLGTLKSAVKIRSVLLAGWSPLYESVLPALEKYRLSYDFVTAPCTISFSDTCTAELLSPIEGVGAADKEDEENELSGVVRVSYGNTAVLVMSDASSATESRLLSLYPASRLKADVLVCGHHGSSTATSPAFVRTVRPAYALISCAKNNEYGHPHRETLDTLARYDIPVFTTAEAGTIHLSLDGTSVKMVEYVSYQ